MSQAKGQSRHEGTASRFDETYTVGKSSHLVRVMIGCPGDVDPIVQDVFRIINEWNERNSEAENVFLLPKHWTKHSHPRLDGDPQKMINSQVVDVADILIAIFRNRLGTPTLSAVSGTAEEISEAYRAGKSVKVYFSDEPVDRRLMGSAEDRTEFDKLQKFKSRLGKMGIYWQYTSSEQLKQLIYEHIYAEVREIKLGGFKRVPRSMMYDRISDISDIGEINEQNWSIKAHELSLYAIQSELNSPQFRIKFKRVDLARLYQLILHEMGIRFHLVNTDKEFSKLYSEVVELGYLPTPPDGNMGPARNFHNLLTLKEITKIQMLREPNSRRFDSYYGYSTRVSNGKSQYLASLEKMDRRGLDMSIFSSISSLLKDGCKIFLQIPADIIGQLVDVDQEEYERQSLGR